MAITRIYKPHPWKIGQVPKSAFKKGTVPWNKGLHYEQSSNGVKNINTEQFTDRICKKCGKSFIIKTSVLNLNNRNNKKVGSFCSVKCTRSFFSGKNNHYFGIDRSGIKSYAWKGGKPFCVDCGKQLSIYKSNICSSCFNKRRSGDKSHYWKGGLTLQKYGIEFNKQMKLFIRYFYNYKCVECGYSEKELGYTLQVHHIDYDKQNNSVKNLLPLCLNCHAQSNFNRESWISYFINKMEEKSNVSL